MPYNRRGVCHSLLNSLVWANGRLYAAASHRVNVKDRPKYADGMWLIDGDGSSTVSDLWNPCMLDEILPYSVSCLGTFSSFLVLQELFWGNNNWFNVAQLCRPTPLKVEQNLQITHGWRWWCVWMLGWTSTDDSSYSGRRQFPDNKLLVTVHSVIISKFLNKTVLQIKFKEEGIIVVSSLRFCLTSHSPQYTTSGLELLKLWAWSVSTENFCWEFRSRWRWMGSQEERPCFSLHSFSESAEMTDGSSDGRSLCEVLAVEWPDLDRMHTHCVY